MSNLRDSRLKCAPSPRLSLEICVQVFTHHNLLCLSWGAVRPSKPHFGGQRQVSGAPGAGPVGTEPRALKVLPGNNPAQPVACAPPSSFTGREASESSTSPLSRGPGTCRHHSEAAKSQWRGHVTLGPAWIQCELLTFSGSVSSL